MVASENLRIEPVANDIFLIRQRDPPFQFSCSDGLLIMSQEGRNSENIVLDANIEPRYVKEIITQFGPVSHYINTHGHLDHIAHVHAWESEGAKILAPEIEGKNLLHPHNFFKCYSFDDCLDYSTIQKFTDLGKYKACQEFQPYSPGDVIKIDNLNITTIPFTGHSISHVGFFLEQYGLLHISCLGFDKSTPEGNGFGPWYGFKHCSIAQYYEDIDKAETLYLDNCQYLTSSHSYIIKEPTSMPFEYMREKISANRQKINFSIDKHYLSDLSIDKCAKKLLEYDLFFPKRKMKGFLKRIYRFWEFWILKNHILYAKKKNHLK